MSRYLNWTAHTDLPHANDRDGITFLVGCANIPNNEDVYDMTFTFKKKTGQSTLTNYSLILSRHHAAHDHMIRLPGHSMDSIWQSLSRC